LYKENYSADTTSCEENFKHRLHAWDVPSGGQIVEFQTTSKHLIYFIIYLIRLLMVALAIFTKACY
jgi:hypothetical protein